MEIIKWVNFDGAGFGGIENYSSSSRRANEDIGRGLLDGLIFFKFQFKWFDIQNCSSSNQNPQK